MRSTRPTTPARALELLGERLYNLVLSDVRMPGMSGLELLKEARQKSRDTLFILMTAYGTVPSAVEAMKEGAYDYLTKPLDMQRLRALVLKALEFQSVVSENNELRQRLRKRSEPSLLVGDSEAIRKVIRMAEEVARSEVTVLIEGESGTGKEIVARMIHARSARAEQAVHLRQLRRAVGATARGGAVRPREGGVHRRGGQQTGTVPAGGRRHAFPR